MDRLKHAGALATVAAVSLYAAHVRVERDTVIDGGVVNRGGSSRRTTGFPTRR
ncbi:MAG: hypothetical protein AVDCRST_MAG75-1538 [uncultured Propionibacteriaceae bacterium]|uniref:Uncharacterized protein n=1 Tax=uncultured Propionibacteriaceae bacterium TaxID=257457 RepID=A0A6J4NK74_9ACTN|nr:MAG: hypothetical protein AVDCRST_MAG75-1538 [uncultured Propionibacteriaceae bacterium]